MQCQPAAMPHVDRQRQLQRIRAAQGPPRAHARHRPRGLHPVQLGVRRARAACRHAGRAKSSSRCPRRSSACRRNLRWPFTRCCSMRVRVCMCVCRPSAAGAESTRVTFDHQTLSIKCFPLTGRHGSRLQCMHRRRTNTHPASARHFPCSSRVLLLHNIPSNRAAMQRLARPARAALSRLPTPRGLAMCRVAAPSGLLPGSNPAALHHRLRGALLRTDPARQHGSCTHHAAKLDSAMRTHTCGELRASHEREHVALCGWVQSVRCEGHLAIIQFVKSR